MLEISNGGLSTTVQDTGRTGFFGMGIPTGGALDLLSAYAANLLVGNDASAAVLEATYTLPKFAVTVDCAMAVTGGSVDITVNGQPAPSWTTLRLHAGDALSFSVSRSGPRAYLAFSGGIDVPSVFSSRSTYLAGSLGGYQGRKLQPGDLVPLGGQGSLPTANLEVPDEFRLPARKTDEVRVVACLHVDRLARHSYDDFYGAEWKLTPLGDRSGLRYAGPKIEWTITENVFGAGSDPSNIVDAGYPLGAIEIPGGNDPILLHRDAPTMGGYAMVGVTARADMDLVGQHMPGENVRFVAVTRLQALEAWRTYRDQFARLRGALRAVAG